MSPMGSNSEVWARNWAVRFTFKNRRRQPGLSGSKSARRRHAPFRGPRLCSTIVTGGTCRSPACSRQTRLAVTMSFMESLISETVDLGEEDRRPERLNRYGSVAVTIREPTNRRDVRRWLMH
jgi:hypothetical protein